jgi:hypothetical protein
MADGYTALPDHHVGVATPDEVNHERKEACNSGKLAGRQNRRRHIFSALNMFQHLSAQCFQLHS